jgi:hypothetical protein
MSGNANERIGALFKNKYAADIIPNIHVPNETSAE